MDSINRAAIVVRPKEPFFEWASSLEGGLPESTEAWCSVYLADAAEDDDPNQVLRRHFATIFEEQLESWHRRVDDWPSPRTFALFEQWFEAEVVDLVFDLAEEPIAHDE